MTPLLPARSSARSSASSPLLRASSLLPATLLFPERTSCSMKSVAKIAGMLPNVDLQVGIVDVARSAHRLGRMRSLRAVPGRVYCGGSKTVAPFGSVSGSAGWCVSPAVVDAHGLRFPLLSTEQGATFGR